MRVLLLAGGYGGARMAHGFALRGEAVELTVVGNTADDLQLHGLHISPDLDTVMYTLAGLANSETGWGVRDDTWSAAAMLELYGAETWFRLGDRDLATHIRRTNLLSSGLRLTEVTARLCAALDVAARLLPMTDDSVRTKVGTAAGWLDFQDYFVRRRHVDEVLQLRFEGAAEAQPSAEVVAAVESAQAIVVAPSNPFVSVGPMLSIPGLLDALLAARAPVVAVSPVVGGKALRGPAGAMLRSLGYEAGVAGVGQFYAQRYPGLLDILVIDDADGGQAEQVAAQGIRPVPAETVMRVDDDRRRLAGAILKLLEPTAQ
jgi:LPPG:FO 2-phospho-L-lactate transferase